MLYCICIFIFNACIFNCLANIKRNRLIDRLTQRGREQEGIARLLGTVLPTFHMVRDECLPWRMQEPWQWLLLLSSPMDFVLCVSSAFRNSYFFTQLGTSRQAHTFVWCSTEATQLISEPEEILYWISWKILCHFANTVIAEGIFKGTFDYHLVMIFFLFGFMHWF